MNIVNEYCLLPVEIKWVNKIIAANDIFSFFDCRVDVIIWSVKNKTSYDALLKVIIFFYCDNQLDSGFAISLALLYAISSVKHVCPW